MLYDIIMVENHVIIMYTGTRFLSMAEKTLHM